MSQLVAKNMVVIENVTGKTFTAEEDTINRSQFPTVVCIPPCLSINN